MEPSSEQEEGKGKFAAGYFLILFVITIYVSVIKYKRDLNDKETCLTKHYHYFLHRLPPLKIYKYNISIPYQEELAKIQYVSAIEQNLAHTTVFEFILHETLEKSKLLSANPNDCDLFYVPLFGALYNQKRQFADIDNVVIPAMNQIGPYFSKHGGIDHTFVQMLFSHSAIPLTLEKQLTLPSMLTLGDLNFDYSVNSVRESWRNVNFPLTSNINQLYVPNDRPISAFFIGQIELTGYDKCATRIRRGMAAAMHEIPHSILIHAQRYDPSQSVYNYNFSRMMMHSEFCVVPHGDGPTTKRLFDTFRTLCIPIVLSNEIRFPFEDLFIDYSKVLMQVPAYKPEMISFAMSLIGEKKKRSMRTSMIEISKLLEQRFDYQVHNGDLSWAWLWIHYFKLCAIASVKRRDLLESKYC